MLIETRRLRIRTLDSKDEIPFVEMSKDGSLQEVGFDKNCGNWMAKWIVEAKELSQNDNPRVDYLAYTITLKDRNIVVGSVGCSYYEDLQEIGIVYFIGAQYRKNGYATEAVRAYAKYFFNHYHVQKMIATVREKNVSSQKVIEKSGFQLAEKKLYRDVNDEKEEMYYFYEYRK